MFKSLFRLTTKNISRARFIVAYLYLYLYQYLYIYMLHSVRASQIIGNSAAYSRACPDRKRGHHQNSVLLVICEGNPPPVTNGFPAERTNNAETVPTIDTKTEPPIHISYIQYPIGSTADVVCQAWHIERSTALVPARVIVFDLNVRSGVPGDCWSHLIYLKIPNQSQMYLVCG